MYIGSFPSWPKDLWSNFSGNGIIIETRQRLFSRTTLILEIKSFSWLRVETVVAFVESIEQGLLEKAHK